MKKQHEKVSNQSNEFEKCCERLHNIARKINVMKRVNDKAIKQVDDVVEIFNIVQTNSSSKIYQTFFHDIFRHCNSSFVFFCVVNFEKKRIIDLNLKDRMSFLTYVRNTQFFLNFFVLKILVNDFRIFLLNNTCVLFCTY